jgi:general secretion pathway protein B
MSYILDALKRADAERDRGHVPGLRSQPVSATAPARRRPRAGRRAILWLSLLGLLAVLLALGAWWFGSARPPSARREAPPATPPVAEPPPVAAPVPAPPPTAAPTPAPVPATPDAVSAPATPLLAPEIAPAPKPGARPPGTAPAPSAPVPASGAGLPELPAGNGSVPALKISGSTYSENPAHRMLIVNGKVLQEGQEVAPGLKLEVIGPHSAVFNHQGARYNVNY